MSRLFQLVPQIAAQYHYLFGAAFGEGLIDKFSDSALLFRQELLDEIKTRPAFLIRRLLGKIELQSSCGQTLQNPIVKITGQAHSFLRGDGLFVLPLHGLPVQFDSGAGGDNFGQ